MQHFHYKNNALYADEVNLADVVQKFGTPVYVYSRATLEDNWRAFAEAFGQVKHRICYAVKANSNLAILNFFVKKGAGFDIVSLGELERVITAGGDPAKIVFSGVGKQAIEIARALELEVGCFNVESLAELMRIQEMAKESQKIAKISLRINPDIDPKTHPYIATGLSSNKFGIEYANALELCLKMQSYSHLKLIGIACHIGSQLTEIEPFLAAIDRLLKLFVELKDKKILLEHINIGGGLGVPYQNEIPPTIAQYITAVLKKLTEYPVELIIEPGRVLVANAGVLLTRIEYLKQTQHKNFAITDAGMNDLLRPALYDAWHDIIPLTLRNMGKDIYYDIVGPVCESADFLGKNRLLELQANDILAICMVGAYGFCMASNYNTRPRAAEVLIDGNKIVLIRQRESIQSLLADELILLNQSAH